MNNTYNISVTVRDRKDLVRRLEELTGLTANYTYVPRCAYEIGAFTVERDCSLTVGENADENIINTLLAEEMIVEMDEDDTDEDDADEDGTEADDTDCDDADEDDTDEDDTDEYPLDLTVSVPLADHTVQTLKNLICTIYSRGALLSKATGGTFHADKTLTDALDEHDFQSVPELIAFIREWEEMNPELQGIRFADDELIFDGFGEAPDAEHVQAFTDLASAINPSSLIAVNAAKVMVSLKARMASALFSICSTILVASTPQSKSTLSHFTNSLSIGIRFSRSASR